MSFAASEASRSMNGFDTDTHNTFVLDHTTAAADGLDRRCM